jgi:hypothetical protein
MKMKWDMVNDVTYKYAKFCYEIICIVGYIKIKKSDKNYRFEIYRSRRLLFLCSSKYKVFAKIFFETRKYDF